MAANQSDKFNTVEHIDASTGKEVLIDETRLDPELHVAATLQHGSDLDEKEYKRVMRKVDWRLMPPLALLYAWALIDRVNLSSVSDQPSDHLWMIAETSKTDPNWRIVGRSWNRQGQSVYSDHDDCKRIQHMPIQHARSLTNVAFKFFIPYVLFDCKLFLRVESCRSKVNVSSRRY